MSRRRATRRVLLINMGGPQDLSEVQPYLQRLFSDPYIIPGLAPKRWLLSRLISRAAARKSRARYALIGGRSPAVDDAHTLSRQLTSAFGDRGVTLECAVGMRYSAPTIEDGLASLSPPDGEPVTPVYLFPHETSVMTGSCADVLRRAAARRQVTVEPGVRHLGATVAYAQGWAAAIRGTLRDAGQAFVLFACHSLPLSVVEHGDPYVDEVQRSVERIKSYLGGLPCGLGYQSQEGRDWLGPDVEDVARDARSDGHTELIVVPLSFVGENTETRVDLDRDLRTTALEIGFQRFERLSTPDVLGFLSSMVIEALCREWGLEC
jgi:ferrochelatase